MARSIPTMDDNSIQSLSDTVVTCCLCNLVFDEDKKHPRLLPCLHSACNRCLEKKNKNKECMTCMHCKTEYDLSKCSVTIFPKDNTKTGILRLFRLKNAEETIKCQECEDELVAQFHCETCSKQLCNDCHQYHRRAKRSHVVSCLQDIPFTLDSAKIFDTRGKCHVSGHEVENLEYYCKKCDIAICSRCVCTIHKEVNGHPTENVCDAYENKKQALISDQLVMENRMSQIDKTVKMIETEIPNIDINSEIASDEIKQTFERVYRMLKDKENDMLKDLKLQAKKKNICLQEQKVKLLSQKQNMADAANFLEASLATSDHSALLSIAPLIYNRLSYLNAQAVDSAPYENACLKFVEFNCANFPLDVGKLVSPSVYGPRTRILLPEQLYAGVEMEISLELYDYGGKTVETAALQVCVDVLKDDKSCNNPVSCVQKKPGTWSCLLYIQLPGEYEVSVSVFGVKLETRPIILDVDTVPVLASAQIPVSQTSQSDHKKTLAFDGIDAVKLLFFFSKELHDIKLYPNVTITTSADKNSFDCGEDPYVLINYPASRKEHFKKEKKRLHRLIDGINGKCIEMVEENKDDWMEAVKQFKKTKNIKVLVLPVWDKGKIYISSPDTIELDKAKEFLNQMFEESKVLKKAAALSQIGRKISDSQSSASGYERQYSDENRKYTSQNVPNSGSISFEFTTPEGIIVKLYKGSITRLNVDAIVNAANENLHNVGGVAAAISKAAGRALEDDCRRKISKHGTLIVGENVVTVSGNLPCGFVIHAVGPAWHDYRDKRKCLELLSTTVFNILDRGHERKFKEIVMPPISAGIFAVPKKYCAAMYLRGILEFDNKTALKRNVKEFHIIDLNYDMLDLIEEVYKDWKKNPSSIDPERLLLGGKSQAPKGSWESNQNIPRQQMHTRMSGTKSGVGSGRGPVNHGFTGHSKEIYEDKRSGQVIFEFEGDLIVQIYSGNLVELKDIDVIVSTENCKASGSEGLAKALLQTGGKKYVEMHNKLFSGQKMPIGYVLMTHAGKLPFRNVFYVIVEEFPSRRPPNSFEVWIQCYAMKNVLEKANSVPLTKADRKKKRERKGGVSTIAMALFGSGQLTTPLYLEKHCEAVYDAITDFAEYHSKRKSLHLISVHLVNMRGDITKTMVKVFRQKSAKPRFQDQSGQGSDPSYGNYAKRKGSSDSEAGYQKFNPEKYTKIDIWKMKSKSLLEHTEIDKFIEPVPVPKSSSLSLSTSGHTKTSNIKLYTVDQSQKISPASSSLKQPIVKKSLFCISCDNSKDMAVLLDCGHFLCSICHPLYDKTCPECSFKSSDAEPDETLELDICVICTDEMEDSVQFKQCKHQFCRECISEYFKTKTACPVCNAVYGDMFGTQPNSGQAKVYKDKASLPGFRGCETFIISYEFDDGIQEECHPNPGKNYKGLGRQAYLPDNTEGQQVLGLLKKAFEQGLIFTIGRSRTTGQENVLTWNDIHHKTRREGGPERFGYPDDDYLTRVTDELGAKGIF